MSLPTIFDCCEPRREVLAGELPDAIFAADLWDAIRGGAHRDYWDPVRFFGHDRRPGHRHLRRGAPDSTVAPRSGATMAGGVAPAATMTEAGLHSAPADVDHKPAIAGLPCHPN